ncbi:CPBP family intramembrane metalloprotease [Terrisporobacter petrolearius]|uniref:CPBP family intramembrane glutamic endopeptidase n=1 Tax=Terrisporobacter petrolearius TaxID=1460447 RepID=UPI001D16D9A6|nr:type II CAAX endopeptidase family protein [Terrisporobacter petrolearius]MCC3863859.1 CPBP family intramembrane metalloprotease [Terrisporobacter petrolearius]
MKQFFKSLGVCLGLYLSLQMTIGIIAQIVVICIEDGYEISKYIYIISFMGQFVTLNVMDLLNEKEKVFDRNIFKKISLRNIIYISLFGVGCSIVLPKLAQLLTQVMNVENQLEPISLSVLQMISVIILIPICEEIMFRHVIFGYLKNNHKIVSAVIAQALVFGLWHGNIDQIIYTFILGIFLALIYMRYNSLLGNIILHIVFNLMGVLIIPKLGNISSTLYYVIILLGILCFVFPLSKIIPRHEKCLNK